MNNKKQLWKTPALIAFLVIAGVCLVRHFHIKNFHEVAPGVLYTSGQPRGMDYTRLLYKYHIATIINLRQAAEHREENWYNEEKTWVRDKVNYVELPMEKHNPDKALPDKQTQKKFLEIMADKNNLPVLIHSNSGRKRVSILAAVWLVKARGYTVEKTIGIVEKIREKSLTEPEKKFIQNLTRRRKAK